jgi:hypothetical protein
MANTLEERISVLETLVAELRAELQRPHRRDSIAKTRTCPCCGSGESLGVCDVKESGHDGLVPFAIGKERRSFFQLEPGAPLQAYVCKQCRYVEWQVVSTERLVPDNATIFELKRPDAEAAPSDAPYR